MKEICMDMDANLDVILLPQHKAIKGTQTIEALFKPRAFSIGDPYIMGLP